MNYKEIEHLIKEICLATNTVKIATDLIEENIKVKTLKQLIREIEMYNDLIKNSLNRLESLFKSKSASYVKLLPNANQFTNEMIDLFNTIISAIEAINRRLSIFHVNRISLDSNFKSTIKTNINFLFRRIKRCKELQYLAKSSDTFDFATDKTKSRARKILNTMDKRIEKNETLLKQNQLLLKI